MDIRFFGHACFQLTDEEGRRVIVDPCEPGAFGGALDYHPPQGRADVVLVSHEHADHSYVRGVQGRPVVLRDSGEAAGVSFRAVKVPHDRLAGRVRGTLMAFCLQMDGVRCCHLGDLGDTLSPDQVAGIGDVDVLMVPVGGTYTIDARTAWDVVEQLEPRIVIPMHYRTERTLLPLDPVTEFLHGRRDVDRGLTDTLSLHASGLTERRRVVVLEAARGHAAWPAVDEPTTAERETVGQAKRAAYAPACHSPKRAG
jgi:L-ascorbate metabolism protein UlaG (beta-lactamase superfamily)